MTPGLGLALVGCALVVLGCFLPAGEPTGIVLIVRDNTLVQMGGGLWLLGGAAVAAWASYSAAGTDERPWHIIVLGLLGVVVAAWIGATLKLDNGEALDPGVGIYVVGLGGFIVAAAGVVLGRENRAVRTRVAAMDEGWFERPDEPGVMRWWDGTRWTGATRPVDHAEVPAE